MMKHMVADAKETLGNVTAKAEEKMDKAKASANEKTDNAMAHDKAGKLEAKQKKHEREAQATHNKDQKKMDNASEVAQAKQDIDTVKATHSHLNLTGAVPMTNEGLVAQGTAGLTQGPGLGSTLPA